MKTFANFNFGLLQFVFDTNIRPSIKHMWIYGDINKKNEGNTKQHIYQ